MQMDKKSPADRFNYEGNLDPVIQRLGDVYKIGEPTDFSVIGVGYESGTGNGQIC